MSPKAVIGVPLYSNAGHLPEALESLLLQTYRDFALVLVDDCSTDDTAEIARHYQGRDDRISYVRNEERLGMVRNWRRAFELARERHPEMEYFAWASDHDVWHPRWLGQLAPVLDGEPDVVMTYPLNVGIGDHGVVVREPWEFDTFGVQDMRRRLALASRNMAAGDMVYSLFRADALARCGVYRLVLLPDRLLIKELALLGQFRQVPETLWFRRFSSDVRPSYARQRASFFPDGAPLYTFLPWSVMHGAAATWSLLVQESRPPGVARREALGLSALHFRASFDYHVRRWFRRRVKAARQRLRRTLPALSRPIAGERAPRIISKAAARASDSAREAGQTPAERVRQIVAVAGETASQLSRERARAAAAKRKAGPRKRPARPRPASKEGRAAAKKAWAKTKAKRAEQKQAADRSEEPTPS